MVIVVGVSSGIEEAASGTETSTTGTSCCVTVSGTARTSAPTGTDAMPTSSTAGIAGSDGGGMLVAPDSVGRGELGGDCGDVDTSGGASAGILAEFTISVAAEGSSIAYTARSVHMTPSSSIRLDATSTAGSVDMARLSASQVTADGSRPTDTVPIRVREAPSEAATVTRPASRRERTSAV